MLLPGAVYHSHNAICSVPLRKESRISHQPFQFARNGGTISVGTNGCNRAGHSSASSDKQKQQKSPCCPGCGRRRNALHGWSKKGACVELLHTP
jgi:hypothetical protein